MCARLFSYLSMSNLIEALHLQAKLKDQDEAKKKSVERLAQLYKNENARKLLYCYHSFLVMQLRDLGSYNFIFPSL